MAITHSLAPIPKWVLINNEGTVAGGAKLSTYSSLNHIQRKPVYQDAGGTRPYTNPIIFDLNGTAGPFYWETDSSSPNDNYYLEVVDANDNPLWTLDNYAPAGGSGGGGNVTTYLQIVNYIANNQFINHIPDTSSPVGTTNLVIAPSNHKGFTPALINPIVGTYGVVGPDIRFIKNNTNAVDQITFPLFSLSSAPLGGDVTPVDYIRYQCTNSPTGETYKNFQFPITQKVKNLSAQDMTFTIWAAVATTPATIKIYSRQYYGSGTAATPESATTRQKIGECVLSTTWTPFNIKFPVPSVAGNSIGTPGLQTNDDAVYIQVEMPLGSPCDIFFTKPCLFLGSVDPDLEFDSYDQIDSIDSTARTGDIKTSLLSSAPLGWLPMNDGTIGNTGSGATLAEGAYTFQLYKTIWDGIDNAWAPVSSGRGATAVADFLARKTLTIPRSLGRALAGAGAGAGLTSRSLGEYLGEESHVLSIAETPSHDHPGSTVQTSGRLGPLAGVVAVGDNTVPFSTTLNINAQGGGGAHNNMQPTSFMNVFIKL